MRSWLVRSPGRTLARPFTGTAGPCIRLVLSWGMAGGVAAGGVLIGALTLTGTVHPGVHFLVAPALFLLGAGLGIIHGVGLGVMGRPACITLGRAWTYNLVGVLCCIPALGVAWVVTAGIALSAALATEWRVAWAAISLVAWVLGVGLCAWAALEGYKAVQRARGRWRGLGWGSLLFIAAVGGLAGAVARNAPGALGTGSPASLLGAFLVGGLAALWIGLPLAMIARVLLHRMRPRTGDGDAGAEQARSAAG